MSMLREDTWTTGDSRGSVGAAAVAPTLCEGPPRKHSERVMNKAASHLLHSGHNKHRRQGEEHPVTALLTHSSKSNDVQRLTD